MISTGFARFFVEANVGIEGSNPAIGNSTNGLGLGIGPVLAYFLTSNVGLEALLKYQGMIGFGSSVTTSERPLPLFGYLQQKLSVINKKRGPRLQRLAHYLVGLIVIVKGIEKVEHFRQHPFICLSLFLIGGFILFANYRHHFFEKHFKEFNVVLFLCEGLVLLIVCYYYFAEGKNALPYAYLVAAIVYFVVAVILYRKKPWTENTGIKEADVKAVAEA